MNDQPRMNNHPGETHHDHFMRRAIALSIESVAQQRGGPFGAVIVKDGAVIYTSCQPCPMCHAAIYWARLGAIYYANTKSDAAEIQFDDAFIAQQLTAPAESRTIPMSQLLRDEAQVAFVAWVKQSNHIQY